MATESEIIGPREVAYFRDELKAFVGADLVTSGLIGCDDQKVSKIFKLYLEKAAGYSLIKGNEDDGKEERIRAFKDACAKVEEEESKSAGRVSIELEDLVGQVVPEKYVQDVLEGENFIDREILKIYELYLINPLHN